MVIAAISEGITNEEVLTKLDEDGEGPRKIDFGFIINYCQNLDFAVFADELKLGQNRVNLNSKQFLILQNLILDPWLY